MIQRKITFYAFSGLLISSVLLKNISPLFIIVLLGMWFWEGQFKTKWSLLRNQTVYLILPIYFLLLVIGLVNTSNMEYGLQKLGTRLPLLLLPVVLPTLKSLNFTYHKRTFTRIFVFSILAAMVICLIRAAYLYFVESAAANRGEQLDYLYQSRYFYGTLLSNFLMHPGYLAMFANVALIAVLYDLKKIQTKKRLYYNISIITALTLFVLILYSKTALGMLLLIYMAFGLRYTFREKKIKYLLLSFALLIGLSGIMYFVIPNTKTRIQTIVEMFSQKNHDPNSIESTQLRVHAWKASRALVEEAPILGHGTGDVWDILETKYKVLGYNGALSNEVNAHNEYYQTALAIGLVGALFLISGLMFWVVVGIRKKHFPLVVWTLITAFALTFESYFSTQNGVVYVSLFLFFVYSLKPENNE